LVIENYVWEDAAARAGDLVGQGYH